MTTSTTNRINELTDDSKWRGGWYQPVEFPDGSKTVSTKDKTFFERSSLGKRKWENLIKPNLPTGDSLLDIGCNSGIHLVLSGFKKLYGVERHDHFYNQCKYVLDKFGVEAEITKDEVLNIELPEVDVTLMSNSLYWVGYSDEEEFIDNYEQVVDSFVKRLSSKTKWLVCIGSEGLAVDRIGGSLENTLPILSKHFKIEKYKTVQLDRMLNIVVCKQK